MPIEVTLRPFAVDDLTLLAVCDSEYDDFGPQRADPNRSLPRSSLDATGGLVVCADGAVAGSVSWHHREYGPNAGSQCLMMGISVLAAARGRGVGTQAQRQLVELAFRHTLVHRIEVATDITNLAEQRILAKLGFTLEGVLRGSQWRRGRHHDMVLYGLLRTDPAGPADPPEPGDH